jgi:hypothetical protein
MNIDNWDIFYKFKHGNFARANLVYVPRLSPDKDIFCMDYNIDSRYFFDRPLYNQEVCDFFFKNECLWIDHCKNESFAPEILEIDTNKNQIFFKWYDTSLNHLIEYKQFADTYIDQLKAVRTRLEDIGIYKINFYPHTTFLKNGEIKIHDFYGCVSKHNFYLPWEKIKPMLSSMNIWQMGQFESDGLLNMEQVYYYNTKNNSGDWPIEI